MLSIPQIGETVSGLRAVAAYQMGLTILVDYGANSCASFQIATDGESRGILFLEYAANGRNMVVQ